MPAVKENHPQLDMKTPWKQKDANASTASHQAQSQQKKITQAVSFS